MPLHYNAFISYKHAPADIAVAKDIQHRLEHFRVPKPIREKTGKQDFSGVRAYIQISVYYIPFGIRNKKQGVMFWICQKVNTVMRL